MKSSSTKIALQKRPWRLYILLSSLLIFAPLGLSSFYWYSFTDKSRQSRDCATRQWHWTKAIQHIASQLRRWEHMAPLCLSQGFVPVSFDPEKRKLQLWTLEGLSSITKLHANMVTFAPPSSFVSFPDTWVCGPSGVTRSFVKQTLTQSVLVFDPKRSTDRLLSQGDLLIPSRPFEYELVRRQTEENEWTLMEKETPTSYLPVAHGIDDFTVQTERLEPEILRVSVSLAKGQCRLNRDIDVRTQAPEKPGYWTLQKDQAHFVSLHTPLGEEEP